MLVFQRGTALRAAFGYFRAGHVSGEEYVELALELLDETECCRVVCQGVTPQFQARIARVYGQGAHAGMVMLFQFERCDIGEFAAGFAARQADQPVPGNEQQAFFEVQALVQIDLQPRVDLFRLVQIGFDGG